MIDLANWIVGFRGKTSSAFRKVIANYNPNKEPLVKLPILTTSRVHSALSLASLVYKWAPLLTLVFRHFCKWGTCGKTQCIWQEGTSHFGHGPEQVQQQGHGNRCFPANDWVSPLMKWNECVMWWTSWRNFKKLELWTTMQPSWCCSRRCCYCWCMLVLVHIFVQVQVVRICSFCTRSRALSHICAGWMDCKAMIKQACSYR